jgi:hypothetical protein
MLGIRDVLKVYWPECQRKTSFRVAAHDQVYKMLLKGKKKENKWNFFGNIEGMYDLEITHFNIMWRKSLRKKEYAEVYSINSKSK